MEEHIEKIPVFNQGFEQLLTFLRDVDGAISPTRFARIFNFDLQTLALASQVPVDKLWSTPHDKRIQRYLSDCLQITQAAANVADNVEKALFWVKNAPIPSLDYKTGHALASAGRTNDVLRYIESLEAGFCG